MALSYNGEKHLKKLIGLMESLPATANKHFSMYYWWQHKGKKHNHGKIEGDVLGAADLKTCGTSACAIGWATTDPYFRKLGLQLVWKNDAAELLVHGDDSDQFEGLANALDLSPRQAHILFGSESVDETPKAWAKRARHCIKIWKEEQS